MTRTTGADKFCLSALAWLGRKGLGRWLCSGPVARVRGQSRPEIKAKPVQPITKAKTAKAPTEDNRANRFCFVIVVHILGGAASKQTTAHSERSRWADSLSACGGNIVIIT